MSNIRANIDSKNKVKNHKVNKRKTREAIKGSIWMNHPYLLRAKMLGWLYLKYKLYDGDDYTIVFKAKLPINELREVYQFVLITCPDMPTVYKELRNKELTFSIYADRIRKMYYNKKNKHYKYTNEHPINSNKLASILLECKEIYNKKQVIRNV